MKILKFEEFINERLFKSSMDRIKTGEVRKEDIITNKIFNYLKDIKWIDMGYEEFLFAEYDIDEDVTLDEISEFIDIKPNDIEIFNKSLLEHINRNKDIENYSYTSQNIDVYENKKTKNKIYFVLNGSYFTKFVKSNYIETFLSKAQYISYKNFDKPQFRLKLLKKK